MGSFSDKPILSICIPTYNRSEYLRKCLESIGFQEEFQKGFVEIVISDNASEDTTEEVVKEYVQKYQNIVYSKNEKNIRDENFPYVLSKGNGRLRRLCNDTMIFEPDSLKEICRVIRKYEVERPYLFWSNGELGMVDNIKSVDFREFVKLANFLFTAISSFSIWDDECLNIEADTKGTELFLWQVRKALELIYKKNSAVICNKKLTIVQSVPNKNISYGLYKVFYQNFFELLEPYIELKVLGNKEKEHLEKELLFNFFMEWCINWELSTGNFQYSKEENLKAVIKRQYKGKNYWIKYICMYNLKITKRRFKRFLINSKELFLFK